MNSSALLSKLEEVNSKLKELEDERNDKEDNLEK